MGLKHAPRGPAGHSGAGTIFSLKAQAKEGVSENTAERGWFFSSHQYLSGCHLRKLGITSLTPGGEMAQEQRATNLSTQAETHWPPPVSTQETAAAGLCREQRLGLRNVPVEGVKIYY